VEVWVRAQASARSAPLVIALAILPLGFLLVPLASIFLRLGPAELTARLDTDMALPALRLSLQTSLISLVLILLLGTPLAYWIAQRQRRGQHLLVVLLQLPIVTPSAVAGVGLLLVFGRAGLLGDALSLFGLQIPFSTAAVVFAQTFVAAPFYMLAARQAFEAVDDDLIAASRTLGAGELETFRRVVVPLALPGLVAGAALSLARALGEFGATIVFAGNLTGRTQTLPLAVYTALQSDLDAAVAIAALLLALSFALLLAVTAVSSKSHTDSTMGR
jgi:molybdate transport system permease protein